MAVQGRLVLLWLCLRAAGFCELHLCCYFQETEGGGVRCSGGGLVLHKHQKALSGCMKA